ncbi:unnamed protein product [Rotaria socialis]|uniref:Uncharacterized protein n=2 Tax=Rotaria socialis TaxID=392032 RepID=A0A818AD47_9BILA|nr:unnamed protein product [Rotaria socialis]
MAGRCIISSTIVFFAVVIIVLGLIPVYLRSGKQTTTPASNTVANLLQESLNAISLYPEGTYKSKISEFTQSTDTNFSFLLLNQTILNQIGTIDNTSFIFETGREQFLYFRIPEAAALQRSTSSLTGIGIYFGQKTDNLNIVPISTQVQPSFGINITPTNLPDRSKLLRVKISTDSTMCSQQGISDSCTDIEYSAYLVSDNTQLSASPITNRANVACGDICSSSSSYSACSASCGSQCDGNQVAGADAPVSRRYNLVRKNAEFEFLYNTIQVKDRMKVCNGAKLLFDSGCVGTMSHQSVYLILSNGGNIHVDVEPNCACQQIAGCTGTAWDFTVVCPDQCKSENSKANDQYNIKLRSSGRDISNDGTLYINDDAEMPPLIALSCESVLWEVSFNYQAAFTGARSFSKKVNGQSSGSESFDIVRSLANETLGGSVTAKWTVVSTKESGKISFKILGRPLAQRTVMAYIEAHTDLWYAKKIAAQESEGRQEFLPNGYPLFSNAKDNGYGIYQLTNPPPTYNEVWNWKANVLSGIALLKNKAKEANSWMTRQRQQAKIQTNREQPVDDERVGLNCFFSDNSTRKIEDTVAIKLFNRASNGHYCSWNNTIAKWKFNRVNHRNESYVLLVCNQNV